MKSTPKHLHAARLLPPHEKAQAEKLFQSLFNENPPDVPIYISKSKLIFQLGSTWIPKAPKSTAPPVIQIHPKLLKKPKFNQRPKSKFVFLQKLFSLISFHYTLEEVLAHEWVHCLRTRHFPKSDQLAFEEILAYQTSSRPVRKYLGPLLSRPSDSWILLFSALTLWFDALYLIPMEEGILSLIGACGFCYLVSKLTLCHIFFIRAKTKLMNLKFPLGQLVKMSDKEIVCVRKMTKSPQNKGSSSN